MGYLAPWLHEGTNHILPSCAGLRLYDYQILRPGVFTKAPGRISFLAASSDFVRGGQEASLEYRPSGRFFKYGRAM